MSVRKNKLSITTSFGWIVFCLIFLILSIWPKSIDWLSKILNISYPPTLFLTLCIVILFVINFSYSKKIALLQDKVTNLAQELSIIKEKVNNDKK